MVDSAIGNEALDNIGISEISQNVHMGQQQQELRLTVKVVFFFFFEAAFTSRTRQWCSLSFFQKIAPITTVRHARLRASKCESLQSLPVKPGVAIVALTASDSHLGNQLLEEREPAAYSFPGRRRALLMRWGGVCILPPWRERIYPWQLEATWTMAAARLMDDGWRWKTFESFDVALNWWDAR